MTTNPLPPSPPPPPGPPSSGPPPPTPPKRVWDDKGNRVVLIGIASCIGLFVLMVVVIAAAGGTKPKTTTTTSGGPVTYLAPAESTVPPTTAAPRTTTTAAPEYVPTPADFAIEVIELERSCFGSAGCNITYKLSPSYIGQPIPASKSYTVTYQVNGGDDGKTGNFTMRGTNASVKSQEHISTPPNPTLTAEVTRVLAG